MHRIRLYSTPQHGACVTLSAAQAHYVARVLRLRAGDTIAAFDGAGHEWRLRLLRVSGTQVQAEIIACQLADTTALAPVILGQALPKSAKMDLIVEKCSELGLTTLVPLYTERTVVRETPERLPARIARWQRIAEAAAKQCGRHTLLDVQTPQSLADFCQHSPAEAAKILCWEGERQGGIRHVLESLRDAGSYVVLIGPEGGWTGAEVELARTHGFVPVSLGPRVLRTETAAIAITSLIRYSRGDLEPYGECG